MNLDGLAERIRAARMKCEAGFIPASLRQPWAVRITARGGGQIDGRAHQKGQGTGGADIRPGNYALGSPHSRAAARALLAAKRAMEGEGTMFVLTAIGSPAPLGTKCTCPIPPAGDIGFCRCFYFYEPE